MSLFGLCMGEVLFADMWTLVFEGELHPYKENFIKFDGRIRRKEPEVKTEVLKEKSI